MYLGNAPVSELHLVQNPSVSIDQIRFVEVRVTKLARDGRLTISFQETGVMERSKRDRFVKRFIEPMLKHDFARKCLATVNGDPHTVSIAWGNGQFGFTGTIAIDRTQAVGGKGSAATIFIDENGPDWQGFATIVSNPDVGLFHELLHARSIQQGSVVNDEEEMERRVIGIGKYTNAKGTENHYREARGLPRRCCWKKESLEGFEEIDFRPFASSTNPRRASAQLGELPLASEFSAIEQETVASEARAGGRVTNTLVDRLFFARYPDRNRKLIDPRTEPNLAQEWKNIKSKLVLPIFEAVELNRKGREAIFANQHLRALELFDRARRIAISPARERWAATFNLGIASLAVKRLAAAIGYFDVTRTWSGISEEMKAKADNMYSRARAEYSKTVP